jgi:hypothetical protein
VVCRRYGPEEGRLVGRWTGTDVVVIISREAPSFFKEECLGIALGRGSDLIFILLLALRRQAIWMCFRCFGRNVLI